VRRHRSHAAQHRAGVAVRLGVTAATPSWRRLLLQNLSGALRVAESAGVRLHARPKAPDRLNQARRLWRYQLTLSAAAILCLSGWPVGQADLPATPGAHPRHLPLPGARDRSRVFATGSQEQSSQSLGISIGDAVLHTVLLGPTGASKSTVMANLPWPTSVLVVGCCSSPPKPTWLPTYCPVSRPSATVMWWSSTPPALHRWGSTRWSPVVAVGVLR